MDCVFFDNALCYKILVKSCLGAQHEHLIGLGTEKTKGAIGEGSSQVEVLEQKNWLWMKTRN